jgi:hypothetical protein
MYSRMDGGMCSRDGGLLISNFEGIINKIKKSLQSIALIILTINKISKLCLHIRLNRFFSTLSITSER